VQQVGNSYTVNLLGVLKLLFFSSWTDFQIHFRTVNYQWKTKNPYFLQLEFSLLYPLVPGRSGSSVTTF